MTLFSKQPKLTVLGIRHHGPGSARRLQKALMEIEPDIILIEGPPEGNDLLPLAGHPEMIPPVALLVYQPGNLHAVSYYPFAIFSPEWQAIRYALNRQIQARFIDLSMAYRWPKPKASDSTSQESDQNGPPVVLDPMAEIAAVAGFDDGEEWWETVIENRREAPNVFEGLLQLMGEIRNQERFYQHLDEQTLRREAFMRREIRKAEKEGFRNIVVVCGAFHAPVLKDHPPVKEDHGRLKGMRKVKTTATWIPWTYERLSYQSGYGAGIHSPQWYEMLFHLAGHKVVEQWMARTAHLFRKEDIDASPAHVIEGVKLAHALAHLRGRMVPGLEELTEAVLTVFCFGDPAPLRLVKQNLIIGQRMGSVPPATPDFPLQKDIKKQQKTLRLKPLPEKTIINLDLRKSLHIDKSHFLHRLSLLSIPWGEVREVKGKSGTFHEFWELQWHPDLEIRIVEAATWGNTVLQACQRKVREDIQREKPLTGLTCLLEQLFLADLASLIPLLTETLGEKVALSSDMLHFLEALPPLVRVLRYGNVRKTDAGMVMKVIDEMVPRLVIGLPAACTHLSAEFAEAIFNHLIRVDSSIHLLDISYQESWQGMLRRLSSSDSVHPKISGGACRILFDNHQLDEAAVATTMNMALSPVVEPTLAAAWIEGFLHGSGLLLIHHPGLWNVLNEWIAGLDERFFSVSLPILRRTFARFSQEERRQMGILAKQGEIAAVFTRNNRLKEENVRRIIPVLRQILGQMGK